MPRHTETRIRDLCTKALSAKTAADIEGIVKELRAALEEHIHLAKEALEVQRDNFSLLDGIARKAPPKR